MAINDLNQNQTAMAAEQSAEGFVIKRPEAESKPYTDQEPIGKVQIAEATNILQKYKQGKENLENRVIENEEYWKLHHWRHIRTHSMNEADPRPTSAWLFNSIINRHADAMDNFPEPNVLPREESDKGTAKALASIIPVVLDQCQFEQTYSDTWWDKLKFGTGIYGVFWNPRMNNGIGDVDIRGIDILSIFWQPGISDIQDSRNLFIIELVENELLEELYPDTKDHVTSGPAFSVNEYVYDDDVDTTTKSAVIDWYYKKNGLLHYVKYVNDIVLYASENDPEYAEIGYYTDGRYPVVFDPLFREKGMPAGFGFVDVMKDPQMYIDRMDSAIMKNAVLLSKPRYFFKDSGAVNEEEYADYSKDFVHVAGSLDETNVKKIEVDPIPSTYLTIKENKINELKETSGNTDFAQGSASGGITAASAIAALQEAGSKTSRDMLMASYRAFTEICKLVIERMRQFYDNERTFRIVGPNNAQEFVSFTNAGLQPQGGGMEFGLDLAGRLPVFDIDIKAQKQSPFSKVVQNELAKELYSMGAFNPQLADQAYACVDMMEFEGKDAVLERIQNNGMMYQQIQQMQSTMMQMASLISQSTGNNQIEQALAQQFGIQMQQVSPSGKASGKELDANSLGDTSLNAIDGTAGKARARTAAMATPKV